MKLKRDLKENTKNRILDAAHVLFTKQGFAATSTAQVAQLAEVTHSLIFHHFKNKQGLWEAVRQRIVLKARGQNELLPSLEQPFRDFIYALLLDRVTTYRQDPALLQIVNWQRIEKNVDNIGLRNNGHAKAWLAAFLYYQEQGEIAKQYKPEFILTLVFAIVSNLAFDPNIFVKSKKRISEYLDFCAELICRGLKA